MAFLGISWEKKPKRINGDEDHRKMNGGKNLDWQQWPIEIKPFLNILNWDK